MKSIRSFSLLLLLLLAGIVSFAQMTDDPTSWRYEVKKKNGNEYELIFHVSINKGWHIWSMNPGGDGSVIPPSFTFDNNAKVTMQGKTTEHGKATTTTMDGIDGKLTYLAGDITYTQDVLVKGGTTITGKHLYQVCNDKMCLRPTEKDFTFEIK